MLLEKTLQSLLDSRRSNQSILKEINSEFSSKGQMLKLKLQYFGHPMQRADSLKRPWKMLGKIEGKKEKGMAEDEIVSTMDSMDMSLRKLLETVKDKIFN